MTNSAAIDQDGSDLSYFASMTFGSAKQEMFILIDTGSAVHWVMGSDCVSETCEKHNLYDASKSTSYKASSDSFDQSYPSGASSGPYGSDTVNFAGFDLEIQFGLANVTSPTFASFPFDGIFGMSPATIDNPGSLMGALKATKAIENNIFGMNLNRAADNTLDGEINFGVPDTSKYSGDLSYTSTASTTDWNLVVDDVGFGGTKAGVTGYTTTVDVGTTYIFIPYAQAKVIHALIAGYQEAGDGERFTVPCSTTTPFQVIFSGVTYDISSKDWVGAAATGTQCTTNIIGLDALGDGTWLFGDTFLKNVYTVFDMDKSRIGKSIAMGDNADTDKLHRLWLQIWIDHIGRCRVLNHNWYKL